MKRPITPAYTFTPGSATLNLSGIAGFDLRNLFAVINLKTGALVYAPAPGFTATAVGTTLTLAAPLTGMAAADPLLVLYDDGGKPAEDGTDVTGVTMPAGGAGIRGWLSAIYAALASTVSTALGKASRVVLVDPATGNGTLVQAFHNSDGQTISGTSYGLFTGGVDQLLNGAGALDRKRAVAGDGMAATGLAADVPMLWNGTAYDRAPGDKTNGAAVNVKALPPGLAQDATLQTIAGSVVNNHADMQAIKADLDTGLTNDTTALAMATATQTWQAAVLAQLSATKAAGSLAAQGAVLTLPAGPNGATAFKIGGTWVGTIAAFGTIDGTTFDVPLMIRNLDATNTGVLPATALVSTAGANLTGFFYVEQEGMANVQVRMPAWTSGAAAVAISGTNTPRSTHIRAAASDPAFVALSYGGQALAAGYGLPISPATGAVFPISSADLGAQADAVATSDTGTFSLFALTKRALQRLTTIIGLLPVGLGQKVMSAAFPVVIASDQSAVSVSGTLTANQGAAGAAAWPVSFSNQTIGVTAVPAAVDPTLPAGTAAPLSTTLSGRLRVDVATLGIGVTSALPGTINSFGTPIGTPPAKCRGVSIFLPPGASVTTSVQALSASYTAGSPLPAALQNVWSNAATFPVTVDEAFDGSLLNLFLAGASNGTNGAAPTFRWK